MLPSSYDQVQSLARAFAEHGATFGFWMFVTRNQQTFIRHVNEAACQYIDEISSSASTMLAIRPTTSGGLAALKKTPNTTDTDTGGQGVLYFHV